MKVQEQALRTLELVAIERGREALAAEARDARSALASRRFNVAVMGQFKRGKSTLINALLGREVLPADVAPVTTAITVVEHGPSERAMARFDDGREEEVELGQVHLLVSEEENPGNRKRVRVVRIELPAPFLASGIRLVDTPGVGSVFANNAEVTHSFVRRIDVAIVVLGSDPPISGEELALVRSAAPGVGRMYFVLNKADLAAEQTRVKAEAFTRKVLAEALGADPGPLLQTSALAALRSGTDPGLANLQDDLTELAAGCGVELALASAGRAVGHVAARLFQRIALERAALLAPTEELDRRIASFEDAMRDIDDLALAAMARTKAALSYDWQKWEARKESFLADARRELVAALETNLGRTESGARPRLRGAAREHARQLTRRQVESWQQHAEGELRGLRESWITATSDGTNRLVDRVAQAASDAFGIPVARFEPEILEVDVTPVEFDFYEHVLFLDPRAFLVPLIDALSSQKAVIARAVARAAGVAGESLRRNLYDVDQTVVQWLDTLSTECEQAMRGRLDSVRREVIDAVAAGRSRRQQGEAAVRQQLDDLDRQQSLVLQAAASAASTRDAALAATGPTAPVTGAAP
jgi:hypothetical protein